MDNAVAILDVQSRQTLLRRFGGPPRDDILDIAHALTRRPGPRQRAATDVLYFERINLQTARMSIHDLIVVLVFNNIFVVLF